MRHNLMCSAAVLASIWLAPAVANAQEAPAANTEASDGRLEEIVVTARKREENNQTVPIAVTALSSAALERQQIRNLEDISQSVPNLALTRTQGSNNTAQIFIRGVGQDDSVVSIEPAIGLYVDGVPYVKAIGALLDLIEFDRIEVLRGPQGTLYGRNSTGGAVKFETRRPTTDGYHYTGDVTLGSFNRVDFRGSFNVPLSSTLAIKLDGISRSDSGYVDNAAFASNANVERNLNQLNRQSVRLALLWTPSDRFSLFASADGTRDRSGAQTGVPFISGAPADNLIGTTGVINRSRPLFGPRLANPDVLSPNRFDAWGGQVTAQLDFDSFAIKSVSGYRGFSLDQAIDTNGGPAAPGLVSQNGAPINRARGNNLVRAWSHDTFTEELQALSTGSGPFQWVIGGFFMRENNRDTDIFGTFTTNASGFNIRQITTSYAAFGEATYKFTPKLELTAGGRFIYDEKEYSRNHFAAFGLPVFTGAAYSGSTVQNWSKFTPRVVLNYHPTDDLLLYTSWAEGYQSGAFQSFEFTSAARSNTPFAPTLVTTYEGGLKSEFFDKRLRFNAAIFLSDYTDIPSTVITALDTFQVLTNDVQIWGTEFEVEAVPIKGLTLYGNLSTLNDRYSRSVIAASFVPGQGGANNLKFAPDISWKLGGEYAVDVGPGTVSFGSNLSYTGRFFANTVNTPFGVQEPFYLLDGQVSFESADTRWKLTAGVKNLTDELYAPQLTTQGGGAAFFAAPRTWSLTLRIKG